MRFTLYQGFVFFITFMLYASLHAIREGWSYSKTDVEDTFNISKQYIGIVDALYLVFYSLGMAVLGSLMHRFTLKNYVFIGLVVASTSYMLWMVLYAITGFYNVVVMTILMCLNGFFQATGWPGSIGIFSLWFAGHKKGLLMGIWSCNANIGNIIAQALLNLLEDNNVNFVWNFVLTGGMGLLVAVAILFFLKEKPEKDEIEPVDTQKSMIQSEEKHLEEQKPAEETHQSDVEGTEEQKNEKVFKYGIFSALCIPKVPMYVFSYACLKGCIYGLLFWLPTLLDEHQGAISDQKGYISSMFDIGAVVGSLIFGFLADYFNKKALFLSPSLLVCSIVMFLISFLLGDQVAPYYVTIFLVGFFISGPYNIIGTLMAIEIGSSLKDKAGVAKVSSLNEGLAALLTTVEMVVIPHLSSSVVFYLFAAECLLATILLVPPMLAELKSLKKPHEHIQASGNQ